MGLQRTSADFLDFWDSRDFETYALQTPVTADSHVRLQTPETSGPKMGGSLFGSCDFFLILLCRYRMWKLYSQVIWNILKAKTWIAKQTPAICIYSYIKTQKVTKSNFLISISLNPNGVNLWFFKFTLFDLAEYHLTAFNY